MRMCAFFFYICLNLYSYVTIKCGTFTYKSVSQRPLNMNIPEEAFRGSSTGDVWVRSIVIESAL